MGDRFNLTGDFRGSIINLKSRLENVQQSVGEIHSDDEEARKELQKLIQQLSEALEKAPKEQKEQVEAVAETAKALVAGLAWFYVKIPSSLLPEEEDPKSVA